jgi:PAS domain S-box-containing protein
LIAMLFQNRGVSLPTLFSIPPLTGWLAFGLGLVFMNSVQNLFVSNLEKALFTVREENTNRQKIEQSLRESETRYKSLFENNHAVMLIIDPETGAIVDSNPAACSYYGWSHENLLNKNIDQINVLTIEEVNAEMRLAVNENRNYFLFKHRRSDGSIRDVEVYSGPVELAGKTHLYSIVHDVTERKQTEMALHESEEKYRGLVEDSPDAIAIYVDGRVVFANNTSLKLIGAKNSEDLLGKSIMEFVHPEYREFVIQRMIASQKEGKTLDIAEEKFIRLDGSPVDVEVKAIPITYEGNSAVQIIVRDITERKRTEDALRASETSYRGLFDTVGEAIYILDQTGKFVDVNMGALVMYGYPREILIGKSPEFVSAPGKNDLEDVAYRLQQAFKGETQQFEFWGLRSNGNIFPKDVRLYRGVYFGQDVVIALARDITERKSAEEALKKSEDRFRAVVQTANDAIITVDTQRAIVDWNTAAETIFGFSSDDALGRPVNQIVPEQYFDAHLNDLENTSTNPSRQTISNTFEVSGVAKDGRKFPIEMSVAEWKTQSEEFFTAVIRDVSERKLAEERIRLSEKKYRELFQVNKDGIAIFRVNPYGPPGKFVEVNHAASEMLGYTREEMLQITPLMLMPDSTQAQSRFRDPGFKSRGVTNFETTLLHKDGHLVFTEFTAQVIQYEDQPAVMNIVRDITERTQREKELQAIASLSSALRTASTRTEMLPVIVEKLSSLLDCETILVEIIDQPTNETIVEAARGDWASLVGVRQSTGTGLNAVLSETRRPYLENHFNSDPRVSYPIYLMENLPSGAGMPLIAQDQIIGFLWLGRKKEITASEVRLLEAVADITANAVHRATLHEQAQKDAADLALAYDSTLEGWAHALELRDQETEGHTRRVVQMTVDLARILGIEEEKMENVRRGALLHDIGKMGIPDSILLKPGTLNDREWEIMRRHPEYAYKFLKPIDYLRSALDIPFCHHEKWDGSGYPRGLKGEEIPLVARIFAIVDVWDALRSDRPYRQAWTIEQSFKYIQEQAKKHFDPRVVTAFLRMIN